MRKVIFYMLLVLISSCRHDELDVVGIGTRINNDRVNSKSIQYSIVTKKHGKPNGKFFYVENDSHKVFFLYFNKFIVPNCKRNFVLQRIMKIKTDTKGLLNQSKTSYRVERFKLNDDQAPGPDEHKVGFSLNGFDKRTVVTRIEYGCGYMKYEGKGNHNFKASNGYDDITKNGKRFKNNLDYYNNVVFESKKKYEHSVSLDFNNNCHFELPVFLIKEINETPRKNYISKSGCVQRKVIP